ncbi:MAG: hypothetical protein HYS24_01505 [Ignavibacteriales bacterium]|nr:hypothetical protein [Ignavibacteriales bacterium]
MIVNKYFIIGSFIIFSILINSSFASGNLLTEILSPFETTDFSEIYDSYSSIIDFIIYVILFVGLSQVTIGKIFDSRGGKAMVVAIGLVLAIGLVISESIIGFNLRSFGPLAATIFIFLVGFVIYHGIKSTGMEAIGAISISLVVTYFSIRSIAPSYFDWMKDNEYMGWLHSVILIAVVISIYKIIKLFFSNKDEPSESEKKSPKNLKNIISKPTEFIRQAKEEKEEENFIKKKLAIISNETGKDSKQLIEDFQNLKKIITEFKDSEKGQFLIAEKIKAIIPKEMLISSKILTLREMVRKVSDFDIKNFENLQQEFKTLPPEEKTKIEKQLRIEWKKLDIEKQLLNLELAVNKYDQLVKYHLDLLHESLKTNNINNAITQINEAIKFEKNLHSAVNQIEHLEKQLTRFTKKGIKDLEKFNKY